MTKLSTIMATLPELSLEELETLEEALQESMKEQALVSLHEMEAEMNKRRQQAGLRAKPLSKPMKPKPAPRRASTKAKPETTENA